MVSQEWNFGWSYEKNITEVQRRNERKMITDLEGKMMSYENREMGVPWW